MLRQQSSQGIHFRGNLVKGSFYIFLREKEWLIKLTRQVERLQEEEKGEYIIFVPWLYSFVRKTKVWYYIIITRKTLCFQCNGNEQTVKLNTERFSKEKRARVTSLECFIAEADLALQV